MKKLLLLSVVSIALSSCSGDSWHGDKKALQIEGKRISVLAHEQKFSKEDKSSIAVKVGKAYEMKDWTVSGGNSSHFVGNLVFSKTPELSWNKNIGEGSSYDNRLIAEPIVAKGIVYAFDSKGSVSAYDITSGELKWEKDFINADDDISVIGAGMAIGGDTLFLTSGLGDVIAVDVKNQSVKWNKKLANPIRTAPTYAGDSLYVISTDSKLFVFDGKTGKQNWQYSSVPQNTTILGGAAPTVVDDIVITVFPSGEILALNAKTGNLLWGEVLSGSNKLEGLSILMDIVARPVVKDGILYVIGHSDVFMAVNIKTGKKIWERSIGGTTNPLLVDDYIFMITNDGDITAIEQKNGKIIWVRTLPSYVDEEEKEEKITWQGPIMLDGRLLIVGSYGEMAFLNPKNGNLISREKVASSIEIPPVYADGNLVLLNSDANLMVYK